LPPSDGAGDHDRDENEEHTDAGGDGELPDPDLSYERFLVLASAARMGTARASQTQAAYTNQPG
jgi:hypothetical protein